MPFIDSKITLPVPQEKREVLKSELGKAVSIMGKPESFLMVGFEDNYDLYMGGNKLDKGAYVSVSLFGNASSTAYEKMTEVICELYENELGIPGNAVIHYLFQYLIQLSSLYFKDGSANKAISGGKKVKSIKQIKRIPTTNRSTFVYF